MNRIFEADLKGSDRYHQVKLKNYSKPTPIGTCHFENLRLQPLIQNPQFAVIETSFLTLLSFSSLRGLSDATVWQYSILFSGKFLLFSLVNHLSWEVSGVTFLKILCNTSRCRPPLISDKIYLLRRNFLINLVLSRDKNNNFLNCSTLGLPTSDVCLFGVDLSSIPKFGLSELLRFSSVIDPESSAFMLSNISSDRTSFCTHPVHSLSSRNILIGILARCSFMRSIKYWRFGRSRYSLNLGSFY